MLQLSGNKVPVDAVVTSRVETGRVETARVETGRVEFSLVDLRKGEAAVLDHIDLPFDQARRLMELGFLPGSRITAGLSAPGGDPSVFQVDGSEIALRRETAKLLKVKLLKPPRVP